MSFNKWYSENKESSEMNNGYEEYKNECEQMGETPMSKKEWAKEYYENNEIGFEEGIGE